MTPGHSQIAHYRITSKLGEGGMGAVYRATDTKLNRDVAIKVLPPAFAEDAARMQRFEREAQVLASLNHPNIAAIYGIEAGAIVMELVEGEDLKGPVAIDTAIAYARQIAAGLEAAHEKGIVHRDLKPANIKVTPDGTVKLLDFGLAKATEQSAAASVAGSPTMSPTLSLAMTQAGMILGTAAYMSPEQARGKPADKRADIWAFGVVLFEMLTGKMLFGGGETVSDAMAAVMIREPDWDALPEDTPAHLRRLLVRCLRKDPKLRLRDIGDARLALDEPDVDAPSASATPSGAIKWWAVALAAIITAGAAFWIGARFSVQPAGRLMRLSVDLGPGSVPARNVAAALSPDGSRIAFQIAGNDGRRQIATRLLDSEKTDVFAGTEGGTDPFFSPDGQWLGFFANEKLKKVPVQGGAAVTLCDAANPRGATWSEDGSIVYAPNLTTGLWLVRDSGGAPQQLTDPTAKSQRTHRWPRFLPGGQSVIFTAHSAAYGFDEAEIDILDLKTRKWKTVLRGGSDGRYLPSGHLVYVRQGVLYAVRFDLSRLEASGAPVAILDDVLTSRITGGGLFDTARSSGTFVYRSGKSSDPSHPLLWLDASGNTQPLLPAPSYYFAPRLSPDGRLMAVSTGGLLASDLYVWDILRGSRTQLTFNAQTNLNPVWTPDGKHLIFSSHTSTLYTMWWIRADGAGQPAKLLESPLALNPNSLSPDGRLLAYSQNGPETARDLWTLRLDLSDPENPKPGKPEVFLQTPKIEEGPMFSPDGRWLAYDSDDTGTTEVYVRPYPGPGGKFVISNGSGRAPTWSRDGRQIFYTTPAGSVMAVDCQARGDSFVAGKPRPFGGTRTLVEPGFEVSIDGKRVAAMVSDESDGPKVNLHVTFLLNFFDELKRRVP
jgi:Tol biopolymer transport system component/predicted Ser/Thr protein kinase